MRALYLLAVVGVAVEEIVNPLQQPLDFRVAALKPVGGALGLSRFEAERSGFSRRGPPGGEGTNRCSFSCG